MLIEELAERITKDIHDSGDDPLDGDETDRIGKLLTLELDLIQGNVTEKEYRDTLLLIQRRV
jgi:hypothetical protein